MFGFWFKVPGFGDVWVEWWPSNRGLTRLREGKHYSVWVGRLHMGFSKA